MPINQEYLSLMIAYAPIDLEDLDSQYTQINNNIAKWTDDQTLYQGMMDKARLDLEARLIVKQAVFTAGTHQVAWQASHSYTLADIVRPITPNGYVYECTLGGVSGGVEPLWPTIPGNTVTDGAAEWTCRSPSIIIVNGGTYNITNISDWTLQDNPGAVVVYQYLGVGWDGDGPITQYITDWGIFYPLIHGSPFGTIAMISALNIALGLINTRRTEIANRNPILIHFTTPLIQASVDSGGGRTITPSGNIYVDYGKNQTFTFGGTVNYVVVDGLNIGTPASYIFINVIEEHAIKVW
jgi:hypothetical protein